MPSHFKTFLKFSIGTLANAFISLITIPIITWYVAPEEIGKATIFTLAFNLLVNFFLLGTDQSFVRFFNDRLAAEGDLLRNCLAPVLIVVFFSCLPLFIFRTEISLILFDTSGHEHVVDWLGIVSFLGCINRFAFLLLRMKNLALSYSLLQVILSCSNLLMALFLIQFLNPTFLSIVLAFGISQLVALIVALTLQRSVWTTVVNGAFTVNKQLIKQLLVYGLPFLPTLASDWILQSSDRVLLRIYSTFEEIGIYTTASRIAAGLNILQVGFSTFWVPFVFQRFAKDEKDKSFYSPIFDALVIAFSCGIYLLILIKPLLFVILPDSYRNSIDIFPVLLFGPMFYTLSEVTCVGINIKKRTIFHFYTVTISAVASFGIGLMLVPLYGALGACTASFVAYSSFFLFRTIFGNRLYPLPISWPRLIVSILAILTTVLYTLVFPEQKTYLIIIPGVIVLIYFYRTAIKALFLRFILRK